ncbi:MAG: hypothetical protein AB1Z63_09335 [Candidatus Limnocylindrales bacterium]
MDEELKQLDLATAQARRLAVTALDALRPPQEKLRAAAIDYVESVATRRLDASRRASVEVMARLSDDELAELRLWTSEQVDDAREAVEKGIASCDFWIPDVPGLSPSDVSAYSNGLVARPRDSRTGIPQGLVELFDSSLAPLRRGLAAIGLALIPRDAEPSVEMTLIRAWRAYRDAAIECVSRWADVDEHYHASAERFQEMRWELAGEVDPDEIRARREAEDAQDDGASVAEQAEEAAKAPIEAVVRADSEMLIPASG